MYKLITNTDFAFLRIHSQKHSGLSLFDYNDIAIINYLNIPNYSIFTSDKREFVYYKHNNIILLNNLRFLQYLCKYFCLYDVIIEFSVYNIINNIKNIFIKIYKIPKLRLIFGNLRRIYNINIHIDELTISFAVISELPLYLKTLHYKIHIKDLYYYLYYISPFIIIFNNISS